MGAGSREKKCVVFFSQGDICWIHRGTAEVAASTRTPNVRLPTPIDISWALNESLFRMAGWQPVFPHPLGISEEEIESQRSNFWTNPSQLEPTANLHLCTMQLPKQSLQVEHSVVLQLNRISDFNISHQTYHRHY